MEERVADILSENLKFYRANKGISQEKLAHMCGLHRTYISDIERKERNISLSNLEKIAKVLNIPPYKLIKKENHES